MRRHAAAIALVVALFPAVLYAQDTVLTVTVRSAEVHSGPSTSTPIIGHASQGAALAVSRNLGSWVRVMWPAAGDGVGFMHVTAGRLSPARTDVTATSLTPEALRSSASPTPEPRTSAAVQPPPPPLVTQTGHTFSLGGLIGAPSSYGVFSRAWRNNRLGIQLAFTRETTTSLVADGRMTSVQIEPGVVYGLFDRVTDYVWMRPYVGATLSFHRQTLADSFTDSGVGGRVFGGSELAFSAVPQFALSVDVGYRHLPAAFDGFEQKPVNVSVAGHWYFR